RRIELPYGGTRLLEQSGTVDRDRGVCRQRTQQRDLIPCERTLAAIGREQHPDNLRPEQQRHAENGHQAFVVDSAVYVRDVTEPLVRGVVVGGVRRRGVGDQAT